MITFNTSTLKHRQRGFVLLPVVMAIALVAAIAFLMNREGAMNVALADRDVQADQARYVAEAGFNHQKWQVQNANCTGYTPMTDHTFGNHTYSTTVTPTDGSPVSITAAGTLDSGTTRTVARSNIEIFESTSADLTLQPDGSSGKDAGVNQQQPTDNHGASNYLTVHGDAANPKHALIQFDLSSLPPDAKIISAQLDMYLAWSGSFHSDAEFSVYRIIEPWVEGNGDGWASGDGVTWATSDGATAWSWPSNYDSSKVYAVTRQKAASDSWHQWDVSTLVSRWQTGLFPNYGLLLVGNSYIQNANFSSSDLSNEVQRPKLTVSYVCECGTACVTATSACDANYAPDTLIDELVTTDYGSSSIKGLSFFPEGKTFKGSSAPAGGAWISVDSSSDEIYLTEMDGTLLASDSTPGTSPTGITFISSGTYSDHLAITDFFAEAVAIVDLDGVTVISFSTAALGAASPVDVAFIGETEAGSYDGMLAVLDEDGIIYIVDQAGALQATVDVSAVSSQVEGIAHLLGKDLFMIADRGLDQNLIVDFSGNLTNSYSIFGFGSNSAYAIAVNHETCEHAIGDIGVDKIITLASAGGGSVSTLTSIADTYLKNKNPNQNRGDDDDVRINNKSSDKEQGLFQFDTGSISPGMLLQSAVLRLNISDNSLNSNATVNVFALIENWVEMEATWNERSTGSNWTTAGGTLISPEVASLTISPSDSGWVEWDITPLVQEWVDGVSSNDGVLVTNSENNDLRFHSRENGDASLNPQLVVTLP